MALHLEKRLDLTNGQVLAVPEGDELVEGAEDVEGMLENLALVQAFAYAADDLGEEVERIDVLENVGLLVGDENHVELVQGLVDKSDVVLLDRGVLGARVGGLGESGKQGLDARTLHVMERSGKDGLA